MEPDVPLSRRPAHERRAGGGGFRHAAACGLTNLPGLTTLAAIDWVRFGTPFSSGYGPVDYVFSAASELPNLGRHAGWLTATHTPFRWSLLHPASFDEAVDGPRQAGYMPHVVLDAFEVPAFHQRFATSASLRLVPRATIEGARIYAIR